MAFLAILLGYLMGSFPSAYIAGRLSKGVDIREVGDFNMGAANTFREIGPGAGIIVLMVDVAKGAIAMLVGRMAALSLPFLLLVGLAAVAGHNWPLFLQFRGGRGAATALGALITLVPREMSLLLGAAALSLIITRNIVFACGVLFAPLPFLAWWTGTSGPVIAYSVALPSLVGFTHFLRARNRPFHLEEETNPSWLKGNK